MLGLLDQFVHVGDDTCFKRLDFEGHNLQQQLTQEPTGTHARGLASGDILAWGQVRLSVRLGVITEATLLVNALGCLLYYAVKDGQIGPAYGPRAWTDYERNIMNFFRHADVLGIHPEGDGTTEMFLFNWLDGSNPEPYVLSLGPLRSGDNLGDMRSLEAIWTLVFHGQAQLNERS